MKPPGDGLWLFCGFGGVTCDVIEQGQPKAPRWAGNDKEKGCPRPRCIRKEIIYHISVIRCTLRSKNIRLAVRKRNPEEMPCNVDGMHTRTSSVMIFRVVASCSILGCVRTFRRRIVLPSSGLIFETLARREYATRCNNVVCIFNLFFYVLII